MKLYQKIGLIAGLVVFAAILLLPAPEGLSVYGKRCLAIAVLMFIWWGTEAVDFGVTSALPMILFPMLKITTDLDFNAYSNYSGSTAILVGSLLIISGAIVKWNLHKRIALKIASMAGGKPAGIIFGFTIATGLISTVISNTTATAMVLPIAIALLTSLQLKNGSNFSKALLLCIPWAAGVGGIGTLLGGATNIGGVGIIKELAGYEFTFAGWLKVGVPFVVILLPVLALFLNYAFNIKKEGDMDSSIIRKEYEALGPFGRGEGLACLVIVCVFVALISRTVWKTYLPFVKDEHITVLACILMFLIPVDWKKGEMLLDVNSAVSSFSLPTVLLIGGSLTLGNAMSTCGVTDWIAGNLGFMEQLPVLVLVIIAALITSVVTEFCTNMVVVAAFLPIMYSIALSRGMDPLVIMVAVTVSASLAFALPSGTPPTALAMATGKIDLKDMVKYGFAFKVISILVFILVFYLITMRLL